MYPKLFILLLASYFVNSSAFIRLKLNTDGDSSEENDSVDQCNNYACNYLCLRLGLAGGVCVGDICKCVIKKELNGYFSGQEESVRDCTDKACDQLCRRLGFKSGSCSSGMCKCALFKRRNYGSTASVMFDYQKNCWDSICIRTCFDAGYLGGYCMNDECECFELTAKNLKALHERKKSFEGENEENNYVTYEGTPQIKTTGVCNTVVCNEMCHRLKYIGGMCSGDYCECY